MEVSTTFIPTAGTVGLLPMVTYFFLVVAIFVFTGNLIFSIVTQSAVRPAIRIASTLTAIIAAVSVLSCYLTQASYHDTLAGLATVTDTSDRQTLIRESYNAVGQFRYMDWFVTAPLLLTQVAFRLNLPLTTTKRSLTILLIAVLLMFFASYIGHQQLSFANEIEAGPKVSWGIAATILYGFIVFTFHRLWQQFREQTAPAEQDAYRLMAMIIATCWGVYLIGYFLTMTDLDSNWIHISLIISDLISKVGVGILVYIGGTKSLEHT